MKQNKFHASSIFYPPHVFILAFQQFFSAGWAQADHSSTHCGHHGLLVAVSAVDAFDRVDRNCVARFAAFCLRLSWACMWEGTMSFLPEFLFYHLLSFCYHFATMFWVKLFLSLGGDSSAALKFVQKVEVQMQVVGPLWELGKP